MEDTNTTNTRFMQSVNEVLLLEQGNDELDFANEAEHIAQDIHEHLRGRLC